MGVTGLMATLLYLEETQSLLWLHSSLKNSYGNNSGFDCHVSVIQQHQFGTTTAAYTKRGIGEFPLMNL